MKAYLLLLGASSCHDGDEFQGIFTDIIALKKAYEQLLEGRGTDYDSYLKPIIYEFNLNAMDKRERILPAEQLNDLVDDEIRRNGRKLIDKHIVALETLAE